MTPPARPILSRVKNPVYDMIYVLTAIGLTPGGSSTEHGYTQTVHNNKNT